MGVVAFVYISCKCALGRESPRSSSLRDSTITLLKHRLALLVPIPRSAVVLVRLKAASKCGEQFEAALRRTTFLKLQCQTCVMKFSQAQVVWKEAP